MTPKSDDQLRQQYQRMLTALDERGRHEWVGFEAMALGRGSIMRVHRASGIERNTIRRGIQDAGGRLQERRARLPQGWRFQPVKTHYVIGEAGRVSPYGVYDVADDST